MILFEFQFFLCVSVVCFLICFKMLLITHLLCENDLKNVQEKIIVHIISFVLHPIMAALQHSTATLSFIKQSDKWHLNDNYY